MTKVSFYGTNIKKSTDNVLRVIKKSRKIRWGVRLGEWRSPTVLFVGEHLCHAGCGGNKLLHFFERVVYGKRCSHCALNAQAMHKRLGAVVASAHSHTEFVEQDAYIVTAHVAYEK